MTDSTGCELRPGRDDDGAGTALFAFGDDVAARRDAFCNSYMISLAFDVFLGDDGIAIIRDGAARHEAYGLAGCNRAVIDDAGADGRHDFIGISAMAMDSIASKGDLRYGG